MRAENDREAVAFVMAIVLIILGGRGERGKGRGGGDRGPGERRRETARRELSTYFGVWTVCYEVLFPRNEKRKK